MWCSQSFLFKEKKKNGAGFFFLYLFISYHGNMQDQNINLSKDCRGHGALLRLDKNPGGQTRPTIVTEGSTGYERRVHEFQGPRKIPKTRRKCWEPDSVTNSFMKNLQNAGLEIKSCRDNRLCVHSGGANERTKCS